VNNIKLISGTHKNHISEKKLNNLISNIKKYRIPLLNMWYDPSMTQKELLDQMKDIDKGKIVKFIRKLDNLKPIKN
jgi:hypothetical protein